MAKRIAQNHENEKPVDTQNDRKEAIHPIFKHISTFWKTPAWVNSIILGIETVKYLAFIMLLYFAPLLVVIPVFVIPGVSLFLSALVALIAALPLLRLVRRLIAVLMNPRVESDLRALESTIPQTNDTEAYMFEPQRLNDWLIEALGPVYPFMRKQSVRDNLLKLTSASLKTWSALSLIYVIPITFASCFAAGIVTAVVSMIEGPLLGIGYVFGHISRQALRSISVNAIFLSTTTTTASTASEGIASSNSPSNIDSCEYDELVQMIQLEFEEEDTIGTILSEIRFLIKFLTGTTIPLAVHDWFELVYKHTASGFGKVLLVFKILLAFVMHFVIGLIDVIFRLFGVLVFASFGVAGINLVHPILKGLGYFGLGFNARMGKQSYASFKKKLEHPWSMDIDDILTDSTPTTFSFSLPIEVVLATIHRDIYTQQPAVGKALLRIVKIMKMFNYVFMLCFIPIMFVSFLVAGILLSFPNYLHMIVLLPALRCIRMLFTVILAYNYNSDVESSSPSPSPSPMLCAVDLRSERKLAITYLMILCKSAIPQMPNGLINGCAYVCMYFSAALATLFGGAMFYVASFPLVAASAIADSVFCMMGSVAFAAYPLAQALMPLKVALGSMNSALQPVSARSRDVHARHAGAGMSMSTADRGVENGTDVPVVNVGEGGRDGRDGELDTSDVVPYIDIAVKELVMIMGHVPSWIFNENGFDLFTKLYRVIFTLFRSIMSVFHFVLLFAIILASGFMHIVVPLLAFAAFLTMPVGTLAIFLISLITGYEGLISITHVNETLEQGDGSTMVIEMEMENRGQNENDLSLSETEIKKAGEYGEYVKESEMQLPLFKGDIAICGTSVVKIVRGTGQVTVNGVVVQGLENIIAVFGGLRVFFAISRDNSVWLCKISSSSSSSTTTIDIKPQIVKFQNNEGTDRSILGPTSLSIVKVSIGFEHALFLSSNGRVYTMTMNTTTSDPSDMIALAVGIDSEKYGAKLSNIVDVSAGSGSNFSFAIGKKGDVFSWGEVTLPSILGHKRRAIKFPKKIDNPYFGKHKVINVECGFSHSIFRTADGKLLSLGESKHGECGHNSRGSQNELKIVESISDKFVSLISASSSAILDNSGSSSSPPKSTADDIHNTSYSIIVAEGEGGEKTKDHLYCIGGNFTRKISGQKTPILVPLLLDVSIEVDGTSTESSSVQNSSGIGVGSSKGVSNVMGVGKISQIVAGPYFALVLQDDGHVYRINPDERKWYQREMDL